MILKQDERPDEAEALRKSMERRIEKLEKINVALMNRVERSLDQQANAYSMFQTAIGLENQVRIRTEELKSALTNLESVNEELTVARDASERANSVKTRFFTAVSHDVLQPLHAAQLSLSSLIDGSGSEDQRRLALQVEHALASVEDLLRTMLDISKLEAGVIKPTIDTIALEPLFDSLVVDMGPLVDAKNLRITSHCRGLAVLSDLQMLRRILQNLLANALHYTREGGIFLAARNRGGAVRIEVWDTGPGIPEAERERIFEEFQRGSTSQDSHRGGFGLGLSIVSRMAQTLEHPLGLCTRIDRGSCFTLTVPLSELRAADFAALKTATPAPLAISPNGLGFANKQVLIIDNDPLVLQAMQGLLARWSCRTHVARDQADIEKLIEDGGFRPDLVLADYHLDFGRLGTDLVARLRDVFAADLPAIIITADRAADIVETGREIGCEVLCKPVRPAELRALMQHLLN